MQAPRRHQLATNPDLECAIHDQHIVPIAIVQWLFVVATILDNSGIPGGVKFASLILRHHQHVVPLHIHCRTLGIP